MKLQAIIRGVFAEATSKIRVDGVPVLALPLFDVLDGSDPADYVNRVEPSTQGGEKIARAIIEAIAAHGALAPSPSYSSSSSASSSAAPPRAERPKKRRLRQTNQREAGYKFSG